MAQFGAGEPSRLHWRALLVGLLMLASWGRVESATVETFGRGVVATIHPRATQAGVDALAAGGNAVDAAVWAAVMLSVVDGHNSGLGGGCFVLVRLPDGRCLAVDGRETAPAAARRDLFVRDGQVDPQRSLTGALAAGIPGEVAALVEVAGRHGRLPVRRAFEEAARVAESGFALNRHYAAVLKATASDLARFPASRSIFLQPDGEPWSVGHVLKQPDLAASLRSLAAGGTNWFYRGPFAAQTADWMRENGGLITRADFESYRAKWREPVRGRYRDCEIVSFPPPSSGGVHVIEILNLIERFDLKSLGDTSPAFVHLVAEAMKLAFADRARWLGDPEFARVPRGLISKEYAAALSASIRPERATPVIRAGMPPRAESDVFAGEQQRHTTHLSAADADGYWVGLTATINTSFGSKVTVPGTGILLNNEMDDFAAQPGVPNYFGLVGSEANAVEGGKRPLSSMSPTIVLRNGLPILCVGAAGGPTIISQTVLAILRTVDFGLPVAEALAQPRFHHQWRPDELQVERSLGSEAVEALRRMGHRVVEVPSLGAAQAVGMAPAGLGLTGSADPRSEGSADGR